MNNNTKKGQILQLNKKIVDFETSLTCNNREKRAFCSKHTGSETMVASATYENKRIF